ncbi:hydrophobic surface binding protein A-domain-containing protein [Pholiota molesta]|nr:hydrophobic surface binding protein A-domain-containing protein [Pholiota molesta]
MATAVTTLDTAIANFPSTGGTAAEALTIHMAGVNLIGSINMTTGDVTATAAFSVMDGTSILTTVQAIEPGILSAMKAVIAKKAELVALPVSGVPSRVYQSLTYLNGNATALANGLIKHCPSSLVANATAVKTKIDAAIAVAISAYAAYA